MKASEEIRRIQRCLRDRAKPLVELADQNGKAVFVNPNNIAFIEKGKADTTIIHYEGESQVKVQGTSIIVKAILEN